MATKNYKPRPNGYLLHADSHRVIIATGFARKSKNAKTGNMIQIWILVSKTDPIAALLSGKDKLVCGNCWLRGIKGKKRVCYVNLGQAPLMVYRAWKRGNYTALPDPAMFQGRAVRFGAYGDPAYMPLPLIRTIAAHAAKHTGYTHQWRNPIFSGLRDFVMASVESKEAMSEAHAAGFRTFRVTPKSKRGKPVPIDITPSEIVCVNETHGITCEACGLCNGAGSAKSIVIPSHGSGKKYLTA